MWRSVMVVFAKETLDNVRDRRSLLTALIYPLVGPILLAVMLATVSGVVVSPDRPITLSIRGAEHAPDLVAYIRAKRVTVLEAPEDAETAVREGRAAIVLDIPPDYAARFEARRPATVRLVVNSSRLASLVSVEVATVLLNGYNTQLRDRRLAEQGFDLELLAPLTIDTVNVATAAQVTDIFLLMVPPLIIFNIFMGGVYMAIDTTSGERERGSLEPLLINPVPRWCLVLGKFLAALLFTAAAVAVQLSAFYLSFEMSGEAGINFARNLDPPTLIGIFAVSLPLMMLAVAVQMVIATVTLSYKEAQTYLGLLPLVPAIPGMVLVFANLPAKTWMMAIPALSQTLLFGTIARDEAVAFLDILVSMAATAALACLVLGFAARLYEREELIFGG